MEEFAYIQLRKSDLLDIHRAMLARWLIEDKLRQTQGLESVGPPLILDRIETLLGMNEEEAHNLFHQVEDELWEHSWYSFTEEWAWHRAEQDVQKELGRERKYMDQNQLDTLTEKRYEANFETYTQEISMDEEKQPKPTKEKRDAKNPKK